MISTALLLLTLSIADPPERWFGEDKIKHFLTSFVLTSLSTSAGRAVGFDRHDSAWLGAGFTLSAGVLKEIHDSRHGGPFSGPDLLWNVAGVSGALLWSSQLR